MSSRFSPAAVAGFELLFGPWMRRRIAAVRLAGLPPHLAPDTPLLLVANHVSWWDGFALRELHRVLRGGAPLYTVMLQREVDRLPFFRWLGAVGIDPASPASILGGLRQLRQRIAERPDAVVAFFPQGRIWPSHRRPLGFRRGVELFAHQLAPLLVLPVALHLEPLQSPAPTLFVIAGEPLDAAEVDAERLEAEVASLLDGLLAGLAEHGEEIGRAWPGPFDPLPFGRRVAALSLLR